MALKLLPAAAINFLRSRPDTASSPFPCRSDFAQDPTMSRRVGILMSGLAADPATRRVLQALVDGLHEHGWQEGRNVMLEARYAGPDPARFPELAAELVALKVDVITTANTQALDAARRNTTTLPSSWQGLLTCEAGLRGVVRTAGRQHYRRRESTGNRRRKIPRTTQGDQTGDRAHRHHLQPRQCCFGCNL